MKNSAFYIVLLLFLAITSFFWFRVFGIKDLPPAQISPKNTEKEKEEAEAFITLAQELLSEDRKSLPILRGSDPFIMVSTVRKIDEQPVVDVKPSKTLPVLSSISYSKSHALAVINGEILAEGEIIAISGSEFMIENIELDRVEISDGEKRYTLLLAGSKPSIGSGR